MVRINKTAYLISTELLYTGGGDITHFTVSFRISNHVEWSTATTILAEVVPKSSNLNWTGVIASSEFAVYSMLEFRVQTTNEGGRATPVIAVNELQGDLMTMWSHAIVVSVCKALPHVGYDSRDVSNAYKSICSITILFFSFPSSLFPTPLTPLLLPPIPYLSFPLLPPLSLPSSPPSLPSSPHTVLPGPPMRIEAVSTTRTSAVLEVQLSSIGTPPLTVEVELTSHRKLMCCSNQTICCGGHSQVPPGGSY